MRRVVLTLSLIGVLGVTLSAQQSQSTPPPVSPRAQAPAPSAPPPGAQGATAPVAGQQTPRPGGAPRDVYAAAGLSQGAGNQNITLVVTISDNLSASVQNKKSVTMMIVDGRSGQVRSVGAGAGVINIDARPTIQRDGRVYLQLTVEYEPDLSAQQLQQSNVKAITRFSESLTLLLQDGRTVVASESSDPRSDRKVSVELTATIGK